MMRDHPPLPPSEIPPYTADNPCGCAAALMADGVAAGVGIGPRYFHKSPSSVPAVAAAGAAAADAAGGVRRDRPPSAGSRSVVSNAIAGTDERKGEACNGVYL